jgi:hypothetical protein
MCWGAACVQVSRVVHSSIPGRLVQPSPQASSHTAKPCCHLMLTKQQQTPAQQDRLSRHQLQPLAVLVLLLAAVAGRCSP